MSSLGVLERYYPDRQGNTVKQEVTKQETNTRNKRNQEKSQILKNQPPDHNRVVRGKRIVMGSGGICSKKVENH